MEPGQDRAPDRFDIGMVVFPGFTNLDLVGPFDLFAGVPGVKLHLVAETLEPVTTDTGVQVLPQRRFDEVAALDMVFIGGGPGVTALMEHDPTLGFLRRHAQTARWVTSVCTGALVLGAAGLLQGYRATTHWRAMEVLPLLGAIPMSERVVIDRNRATGGGVTAGLDFGLTLIERIWGRETAERVQLGIEYDPGPPIDSGSPAKARPEVLAAMTEAMAPMTEKRLIAARRAAARLGDA